MSSPAAPSTDPTITELRDPKLPSEPKGGVSLSVCNLATNHLNTTRMLKRLG